MIDTTHAHQCPHPNCNNSPSPDPIECDELPGDCAFEGVEVLICYDCAVSTSWERLEDMWEYGELVADMAMVRKAKEHYGWGY
jgi:hypothetical protein